MQPKTLLFFGAFILLFVVFVGFPLAKMGLDAFLDMHDRQQRDLERRRLADPGSRTPIKDLVARKISDLKTTSSQIKLFLESLTDETTIQSNNSSVREDLRARRARELQSRIEGWNRSQNFADDDSSRQVQYSSTNAVNRWNREKELKKTPKITGVQAFQEIQKRFRGSKPGALIREYLTPNDDSSLRMNWATKITHAPSANERRIYVELKGQNYEVLRRQIGFVTIACIKTAWSDPTFRAKIFEESVTLEEKRFRGMQDIEIGSSTFDATYIVQSNDKHLLRRLFSEEACEAILRLGKSISLTIGGGALMLELIHDFNTPRDGNRIADLVADFSQVYDVLAKVENGAIFNSVESSLNQINSSCMVCGQPIESDPVSCDSCMTPHHRECWEYMEKCSTFACGGTSFSKT